MDTLAGYIDHAVLHPMQTDNDLRAACAMCDRLQVASICVKPYMVASAVRFLAESTVKVGTVIGFPHGSATGDVKTFEAGQACLAGASELDMVVNIGKVFQEDWQYVEVEIGSVVEMARQHHALTKVIFETGLVTSDELKIRLCEICESTGADFVKTSTGFGFVKQPNGATASTGASEHDVSLMRQHCSIGVKASGGIRTLDDARRYLSLGATRLGTSSTRQIVDEEQGIGDSCEGQADGY